MVDAAILLQGGQKEMQFPFLTSVASFNQQTISTSGDCRSDLMVNFRIPYHFN